MKKRDIYLNTNVHYKIDAHTLIFVIKSVSMTNCVVIFFFFVPLLLLLFSLLLLRCRRYGYKKKVYRFDLFLLHAHPNKRMNSIANQQTIRADWWRKRMTGRNREKKSAKFIHKKLNVRWNRQKKNKRNASNNIIRTKLNTDGWDRYHVHMNLKFDLVILSLLLDMNEIKKKRVSTTLFMLLLRNLLMWWWW